MIESKELRIGNYVSTKYMSEIGNTTIMPFSRDLFRISHLLEPIPLTQGILFKCGFEKTNRIDFGELKECYANFSFALMIRHNSLFVDWIGGNTEVKYLHTLQNVFYVLTGEELNVELCKMKKYKDESEQSY